MKLNLKILIVILIILGTFIAFVPKIYLNLYVQIKINEKNSANNIYIPIENNNWKISAISKKIHIVGNSGWLDFKNAGNCMGNGTSTNPYLIEDLVIDAGGFGSSILIENSTVFFKIVNCSVYNSSAYWLDFDAGIKLSCVNNGQLINNSCTSNYYGIYAKNSNNLIISENFVNYNRIGINFRNCVRNTIIENRVEYNIEGGIDILGSRNNNILRNFASNSKYEGITLSSSNNNTVMGNTANNNTFGFGGVFLSGSNYNTVIQNTINNNSYGIFLSTSYNNIISGNNASYNGIGICLDHLNENNTISGNNANHNRFDGIFLWGCDSNNILENTASYNNNSGIALFVSSNNFISGNTANFNKWYGIWLTDYSCHNIVFDNNLHNNMKGNYAESQIECLRISGYNLFFLLGFLLVVVITLSKKIKK